MREQGLSIIIPVKGRVRPLRALLDSLDAAIAQCAEPVEIIVVDDSGPADERLHRENCAAAGARYVRGSRHVGAKRNQGAELARFDLLYFIDSDCRATPALLQRHIKAHRGGVAGVAALAGPTLVEAAGTLVYRIMRRSRLLNEAFEWPLHCETVAWATTSNLSVRYQAFAAVGGFAGRPLTVAGGEDVDLCLRLVDAGGTISCDAEAVVIHDAASSDCLSRVARRLVTYGQSGQWLLSVHPERRRPKLNRIAALAVTAAATAVLPRTVRSAAASRRAGRVPTRSTRVAATLLPGVALLLLGRDVRDRLEDGEVVTIGALAEATACAAIDWCFDLGEVVGACRLGRPDRVFTAFGWIDDAAHVWRPDTTKRRRYGG